MTKEKKTIMNQFLIVHAGTDILNFVTVMQISCTIYSFVLKGTRTLAKCEKILDPYHSKKALENALLNAYYVSLCQME